VTALNDCLGLCQTLCQAQSNNSSCIIDVMASRLSGVDVTELMACDKAVYEAHCETKVVDDKLNNLLGWHGYHYLPLLIRNYFQILFHLIQKDFKRLNDDAYTKALITDEKLYNQTVLMVNLKLLLH